MRCACPLPSARLPHGAPDVRPTEIDEWTSGAASHNSSALATAGYRQARTAWPHSFVQLWVGGVKDPNYIALLKDGTIDLAIIEGYTYCPHAKHADSCPGPKLEAYFELIDWMCAATLLLLPSPLRMPA